MAYYNPKTNKYSCSICGKEFVLSTHADSCRDNHSMLYVPMTKEELNRLVQFIYTKNDLLLVPELIKRLQRFSRRKAIEP